MLTKEKASYSQGIIIIIEKNCNKNNIQPQISHVNEVQCLIRLCIWLS